MNGNVFLTISEVTAVEVHAYAFKDVLSVPISGRSRCMGGILFFKCKGKAYYCAVEFSKNSCDNEDDNYFHVDSWHSRLKENPQGCGDIRS